MELSREGISGVGGPPARCDIGAFELQTSETPNAMTLCNLATHSTIGVYAGALPAALGVVGALLCRRARRRK